MEKMGLMLVLPATWEVDIRRISVQNQPGQNVSKIPSKPIAGHDGPCLKSQLYRKQK
jgi:hypothetical protein